MRPAAKAALSIDTKHWEDLMPLPDSTMRRVAGTAYQNADASLRGSGATVWLLAESTGDFVASAVLPPGTDPTGDGESRPFGFYATLRQFPQATVGIRGLDFTLVRPELVLQSDTVRLVWTQMMAARSR